MASWPEVDERRPSKERHRWRRELPTLALAFFCGALADRWVLRSTCSPTPPPPPLRGAFEERGPPTKQELGQAGWTLLHTMVANVAEQPTEGQRARIEAFLHALGHLYPCPDCAAHFRRHAKLHPIVSDSREGLSRWLCEAHNEVNVRNGKEAFYCDIGVLDARWKDCGCDHAANHSSAVATSDAHEASAETHPLVVGTRRGSRRRLRDPPRERRLAGGIR